LHIYPSGQTLAVNIERVIVTLVIASFALTSINTLILQGNSLTREEAIEISRNSKLVQSLLEGADWYTVQARHLNKTQNGKDHEIWHVTWHINPQGLGGVDYLVTHDIDEETGETLYEACLGLR